MTKKTLSLPKRTTDAPSDERKVPLRPGARGHVRPPQPRAAEAKPVAAPAPQPKPLTISGIQQFFAPSPRGLEHLLADELIAIGAGEVRVVDGGAAFSGEWSLVYQANLHSRIASRILWRLDEHAYRNEADLFRMASRIDWPALFDVYRTIKVGVTAQRSPLRSVDFAALKIKDAVCDVFRAATGQRPSVDTAVPDVRLQLFLTDRVATLYLDTSGEPLFKRGHRVETVDAPLRENLAVGLLQLAGWHGQEALFDPMCGSGTFVLEAAAIALKRAPGRDRQFAFEKLKPFQPERWQSVRAEARAEELTTLRYPIVGSDRDAMALDAARANIKAAGLESLVTLKLADVLDVAPPAEPGCLIANPPYGVRLEDQEALAAFYPQLGDGLKRRFSGWRAFFFTGDQRLPKLIRLSPSRRTPLYNGALECRLYEFQLVAGSNR
ncbi:THUMP domain-containing class I SAM-dependent RNA methyltransferase [Chitinolyticbacter meiyuanensis]|uniref:THUMP domain-containing class I SAM-dependent RNA methyltransferase n=1 Tax=Chitinolyticbacter meiyuanensis TaxID=682798 RepID=UPI001652117E|nr:THUMP domain-containing protein [Chitinolyticbacter meiyuanensis]